MTRNLQSRTSPAATDCPAPLRAGVYLRVSTGRRARLTQQTGTSSTGRVYAYYTCASRAQKGPTACRGNTIRMAFLDDLVLTALKENMFAPERLTELLSA